MKMSKPTEQILANYETEKLKKKLLEFPGLIQTQKKEIRVLRDAFKDADSARSIIEADLATDINAEIDKNTGKQKFSNKESREVELMRRKLASAEYQEANRLAREAGYALGEAEDEQEALQDKYRSYRYVVRMVSAELELMAGDAGGEEVERAVTSGGAADVAATSEPY